MGITLSQVAQDVPGVIEVVGGDVALTDITHDSRQATSGTLFVAVPGENLDGHRFIGAALERGASAVVVEHPQPDAVPQLVVEDSRVAMAWAARAIFGRPDTTLRIAGITGTNGKTTVVHMVEAMFAAAGDPIGIIGTLGARVGSTDLPLARTTPEASDLQRILAVIRDSGARAAAMEVSSHAVDLHRSDAIEFHVVAFTNLTRDHLDFHGDMESYFRSKGAIFSEGVAGSGVINVDDPWGARLASEVTIPLTRVSLTADAEITATDVAGTAEGTSFDLETPAGSVGVRMALVGEFNVLNALVAAGVALELGLDLEGIRQGLERLKTVPGRMEVIAHTGPFSIVVDYAHTPDAIGAVLESVKSLTPGRVISVVGAGGDRDTDKRALMGGAAARGSDVAIITTDNPRSERPEAIAEEVRRGAEMQGTAEIIVVLDRRRAIDRAVHVAGPGDMILVLGKGHEQGQDIGTQVLPFDDRDEVRDALNRAGWVTS